MMFSLQIIYYGSQYSLKDFGENLFINGLVLASV